jgi:phenylacetic acid degradation operon negative regulatory protein
MMTYFYHSLVDSPHLPRDLEHDSAQSMVVTLLGEFWRYSPSLSVPSAGIVELLETLNVSGVATRAALSRLARRGTLDVCRSGRNTSYSLTTEVAVTIPASETLTMSFGQTEREWDNKWTVIVFSIPETQRDLRQTLRESLRWLSFGPARDGVWISPHADVALTQTTLEGLLPEDGLVFRSSQMIGKLDPFEVWPLAEIRDLYRAFIAEMRPSVYRLRSGMISPADALRLYISVLGRWRGFPTVDPDLPCEYLPNDWPRREARRLFVEIYDACVPLAELHVRNVVRKYDGRAAAAVQGLTVDQSLDLYRSLTAPTTDHDDSRDLVSTATD